MISRKYLLHVHVVSGSQRMHIYAIVIAIFISLTYADCYAYQLPQSKMQSTSMMRQDYYKSAHKTASSSYYNSWQNKGVNKGYSGISPITTSAKRNKSTLHSYGGNGLYFKYQNKSRSYYNYTQIHNAGYAYGITPTNPYAAHYQKSATSSSTTSNNKGYILNRLAGNDAIDYSSNNNLAMEMFSQELNKRLKTQWGDNSIEDEFNNYQADFLQWLTDNGYEVDSWTEEQFDVWWNQYEYGGGMGIISLRDEFYKWLHEDDELPIGNELWVLILLSAIYALAKTTKATIKLRTKPFIQ